MQIKINSVLLCVLAVANLFWALPADASAVGSSSKGISGPVNSSKPPPAAPGDSCTADVYRPFDFERNESARVQVYASGNRDNRAGQKMEPQAAGDLIDYETGNVIATPPPGLPNLMEAWERTGYARLFARGQGGSVGIYVDYPDNLCSPAGIHFKVRAAIRFASGDPKYLDNPAHAYVTFKIFKGSQVIYSETLFPGSCPIVGQYESAYYPPQQMPVVAICQYNMSYANVPDTADNIAGRLSFGWEMKTGGGFLTDFGDASPCRRTPGSAANCTDKFTPSAWISIDDINFGRTAISRTPALFMRMLNQMRRPSVSAIPFHILDFLRSHFQRMGRLFIKEAFASNTATLIVEPCQPTWGYSIPPYEREELRSFIYAAESAINAKMKIGYYGQGKGNEFARHALWALSELKENFDSQDGGFEPLPYIFYGDLPHLFAWWLSEPSEVPIVQREMTLSGKDDIIGSAFLGPMRPAYGDAFSRLCDKIVIDSSLDPEPFGAPEIEPIPEPTSYGNVLALLAHEQEGRQIACKNIICVETWSVAVESVVQDALLGAHEPFMGDEPIRFFPEMKNEKIVQLIIKGTKNNVYNWPLLMGWIIEYHPDLKKLIVDRYAPGIGYTSTNYRGGEAEWRKKFRDAAKRAIVTEINDVMKASRLPWMGGVIPWNQSQAATLREFRLN